MDRTCLIIGKFASRPNAFAGRYPKITENTTWVEDGHRSDRKNDQGTFEDHKGDFIVGKVTAEPIPQLGDAIGATDKDKHGSNEETLLLLA